MVFRIMAIAISWTLVRTVVPALRALRPATRRLAGERGQDLLEYALLGGLIAAAIIAVAGLGIFRDAVLGMGNAIAACISFETVGAETCNLPGFLSPDAPPADPE